MCHPQATFYVGIAGDSMSDIGILDGAVVLMDKAIKPRHSHIVIAVVDGDFTFKWLDLSGDHLRLLPENPAYPVISPKDCQTWTSGCIDPEETGGSPQASLKDPKFLGVGKLSTSPRWKMPSMPCSKLVADGKKMHREMNGSSQPGKRWTPFSVSLWHE